MRNLVLLLVFSASLSVANAQQAAVVKFDKVEKILSATTTEIQVINFWATWCAPCVKELPLFESLNAEKRKDVKITLISLDFAEKIDKVNSFISRKKITAEVLLLDEIDYNSWIDKVDKSWAGALPATLVLNPSTGKRKFVESELKEGDLQKLIAEVQK